MPSRVLRDSTAETVVGDEGKAHLMRQAGTRMATTPEAPYHLQMA